VTKRWLGGIHPAWAGIALVLFFLWNTPFILPLKIFVVFLHELSHALAAFATGGRPDHFVVHMNEGGHAITTGGNRFVILSAGYLGSLCWGGLIMVLASRTKQDGKLSMAIGILTALITVVFVRNWFGIAFGLGFGAAMVAAGYYLRNGINDLILRVIGFTGCIYAVLDIFSDVIFRSGEASDARMLAEHTGIPTIVWGVLWVAIAVAGTLYFLSMASKNPQTADAAGPEAGTGTDTTALPPPPNL
jgi:hypothetical protein